MHRCLALVVLASLPAQNPPLNPSSNLVLDTNPSQGQFAFSLIDIPAGVRVTFTGDYPVQLRCEGDAVIRGQLDVDAAFTTGGPGAVATGTGAPGQSGAGYPCYYPTIPAGNGSHAGLYGAALPFDLAGGSPGGATFVYGNAGLGTCALHWVIPGGGGGGTLVLEAAGRIDVHGRISANGSQQYPGLGSLGSGGSILLRSFAGLTVHPAGLVQATAEPNTANAYPPGIIRLDAYGSAPVLQGAVDPQPLALELPYLEHMQPPVLGTNWQLRVVAPRGDGVSLAVSFAAGSTTNQFGTVQIDLASAVLLAFLRVPSTGHDPYALYQLAVPNVPAYLGLPLHLAGLDWATGLPPRYTNTIHTMVQ